MKNWRGSFRIACFYGYSAFLFLAFGRKAMANDAIPSETSGNMANTGGLVEPLRTEPSFDSFAMMGQVLFALIFIIGIFFVLMKILNSKKNVSFSGPARTLGGVALGPNKSLQIIEVGRSLYVIGVGDDVQLLDKIADADEIAFIKEGMPSHHASRSFTDWIRRLTGKGAGKREAAETEPEQAATFQQIFRQKMKNVTDRKQMVEILLAEEHTKERSNGS